MPDRQNILMADRQNILMAVRHKLLVEHTILTGSIAYIICGFFYFGSVYQSLEQKT